MVTGRSLATPFRSALYVGTVNHARCGAPTHSFRYRVTMPLLFLDEIDEVCASLPFWSSEHRAPVEFRRSDFIAASPHGTAAPLQSAVVDAVVQSGRSAPTGPITLLANLRSFGWQFNPIALYFCYDAAGSAVETLVAEVTNTPWKQRHRYVVNGPGEHCFDKQMHVSPFMTMNYAYRFSYNQPCETINVAMSNYRDNEANFRATLNLNRTPLTPRSARGRLARILEPVTL